MALVEAARRRTRHCIARSEIAFKGKEARFAKKGLGMFSANACSLKLSDIDVGGLYTAKVSGQVVTVPVVEVVPVPATGASVRPMSVF